MTTWVQLRKQLRPTVRVAGAFIEPESPVYQYFSLIPVWGLIMGEETSIGIKGHLPGVAAAKDITNTGLGEELR